MGKAKKIQSGIYEYKGYRLVNYGYYPPDHCIWWQAINMETDCADYSRTTKKELMDEIDEYERIDEQEKRKDDEI